MKTWFATTPPEKSTRQRGRTARALGVAATTLLLTSFLTPMVARADSGLPDAVLSLGFENTVADSSPSANPTSLKGHNGSATLNYEYVPGVKPQTTALSLKGNTYLDLGTNVALQPQNLTLSFWINPNAAMSGEQVISWNKGAYNTDGWYLSSESNTSPLAISIGPATGQPYKVRVASTNRATFFPVGEWTHLVVVYDKVSKDVTFYRNGEPVADTTSNAFGTGGATGVLGSSPTLPKTIGFNGPSYNGAYLNAAIDEYRLYDAVATQADVVALYEESGRQIDRLGIAQSDAAALSLPSSATLALILTTTGSRGTSIAWESSQPAVISTTGVVNRPAEGADDAEVALTARVSYLGGPVVSRTFDVTVPAQSSSSLLQDSGLGNIELSSAYLNNAASKEHEYLLTLSSKKFLYEFYKVSGLTPPTTSGYGGWERSDIVNFRGHAFGHYMSGLAQSYGANTDPSTKAALLTQITDAVNGLEETQDAYTAAHPASAGYVSAFRESILDKVQGTGTSDENVIVPWYNLHKILAGLLDIAEYVDGPVGDEALDIASQFSEYVYKRISQLSNTSTLLGTEYGGMNEALYEIFDLTGNDHFKKAAEAFDETALFEQLAAGNDILNGRHANTTIPKLIGALKRYTVFTQNESYYSMLTAAEKQKLPMYLAAAENFFQMVVDNHTYATGANSQSEHFHGPDTLYQFAAQMGVRGNAETAETCNEYNMLKLARELFKLTKDVKYADYYENTFINTILSSQNPETGMTTYFQAMTSGYMKVYSTPLTDFWCCWGTGRENFSKLGDSFYFTGQNSVYVNLFFSSTFNDHRHNLKLTQSANLPTEDTATFTVSSLTPGPVAPNTSLRLRVPNWIAGEPTVTVNGQPTTPQKSRGYLVLPSINPGDVITYKMPMNVTLHAAPDNENFVAFKYGPVVLSAGLGTKNITATEGQGIGVRIATLDPDAQTSITPKQGVSAAAWRAGVATNVERISNAADGSVRFKLNNTADSGQLVFTPHFMRYKERYGLYMNIEAPDSQLAQDRIRKDKENLRVEEQAVDLLTNFDGNNFEAAKSMKSQNSTIGLHQARQYRDARAGGWFSYDLTIDPSRPANHLRSVYFSGDNGRSFDLYINDEKFKTVTVTNAAGSGVFYSDTDQIPAKYLTLDDHTRYKKDSTGAFVLDTAGNKIPVITVRYQSTGGFVGGLFGVYILRSTTFDTNPDLSALSFDSGTLTPAFSSETKSYTLTVPADTTSVNLDAAPHTPSGLVFANGILFDDTTPRSVPLADGQADTELELKAYAQDHTANTTYNVTIVKANADTAAPVTEATVSDADPALVTLTATDNTGGSGIDTTEYRISPATSWTSYTTPFSVSKAPDAQTIEYRSTDLAGNVEDIKTETVPAKPAPLDTTKPVVTVKTTPANPNGTNGWFKGTTTIKTSATFTDPGTNPSGVATKQYRIGTGAWKTYTTTTTTITAPAGTTTYSFRATDNAGNTSAVVTKTVKKDNTTPVTKATTTPKNANGTNGWFKGTGTVKVTLTATDTHSGVAGKQYRIGSGAWKTYSTAIIVPEGTTKVSYRATDKAGNQSSAKSLTVRRDSKAPALTITVKAAKAKATVTLKATDAGSKVAKTTYRLDGGTTKTYARALTITKAGRHTVKVTTTDKAGNTTIKTVTFMVK